MKQRLRFLLGMPGLGWRKAGQNISKAEPKDNFSKNERISLYGFDFGKKSLKFLLNS